MFRWLTPLLLIALPSMGTAHELPLATGAAANADGEVVALRTTRGFFVRQDGDAPFRLQCLEYSGLLESEAPDFVVAHGRLWVSTVRGLVSFDTMGCDRLVQPEFVDVATFDVTAASDGALYVITGQSGFDNDVYRSVDGAQWERLQLVLDGALLSRFRQAGSVWIASGLRFDPAAGGVVHVVREYTSVSDYAEVVLPTDGETFRALVLDAQAAESAEGLILVDRFVESTEPDQLLRFRDGQTEPIAELFEVSDAQFGPDGAIYAGHRDGLLRIGQDGRSHWLAGVRVSGVYATESDVFVMTEYAVDQYALGRWTGDGFDAVLSYGGLEGPTVCADAPGVCDADWDDWLQEIPRDGDADRDAGSTDDAGAVGDGGSAGPSGGGCAAAPPSGAVTALLLACAGWAARRRRTPHGCVQSDVMRQRCGPVRETVPRVG